MVNPSIETRRGRRSGIVQFTMKESMDVRIDCNGSLEGRELALGRHSLLNL